MTEDESNLIDCMEILVRTANFLTRAGIHTVSQLTAMNRKELLSIPGIGPITVKEIERVLSKRNGAQFKFAEGAQ
jgi:DNA-directed RNA polymerase alpha subunit